MLSKPKKKRTVKYMHLLDGKPAVFHADCKCLFPRSGRQEIELRDTLQQIYADRQQDRRTRTNIFGTNDLHPPVYFYARVYVD